MTDRDPLERLIGIIGMRTQKSRDTAEKKAGAIIVEFRASKMSKAADIVEQTVHETRTTPFLTFTGGRFEPTIHWSESCERFGAGHGLSAHFRMASPASTSPLRAYAISPEQRGDAALHMSAG